MSDAFYSIYVNLIPRLDRKLFTDVTKDINTIEDKINSNASNNEKKTNQSVFNIKKVFDETLKITKQMSVFSTIFGALTKMKFDNLQEINDNLKNTGEKAQNIFDILNASTKTMGAETKNVLQDINKLYESKRNYKIKGVIDRTELGFINSSLNDSVDTILVKYREAVQKMSVEQGKVLTQRLNFSDDLFRVARLNQKEFDEYKQINFYNKENLLQLEQSVKATKEVMGTLGNTKDLMLVKFSPFVVSFFNSVQDFLNSKEFSGMVNSLAGLSKDIADFNNTLKGAPLKLLVSLLGIKIALDNKLLFGIAGAASAWQDLITGIKNAFTNPNNIKKDPNYKKSATEDILSNKTMQDIGSYYLDDDEYDLQRAIQKSNEIKQTINNNTNITINAKTNASAKEIATEIKRVVENKNKTYVNQSDKR